MRGITSNGLTRLWFHPRESTLRIWMFNVHLYAGLALGILTTLVGLTGSVVVYKPEIERAMAGPITHVVSTGEPRPLDELYATVRAATPNRHVERLFIWGGPRAAWAFRVHDSRGNREYVYVDPHAGQVLGRSPMDGTWLQWSYNLHDNLLLGKAGLVINGFGALLLVAMCLTGAIIWWPGAARLRDGFSYHPGASWQGQIYDLHKISGIAVMLILAVIAVSGASYAFPESYRKVCNLLTGTESFLPPPKTQGTPESRLASLDSILRVAQQTVPEADLTVLTWPTGASGAFVVRKRLPGDWSRLGNQYVYIDPRTAAVLRQDLTARMPVGRRIMQAMAPLHYGSFGGDWTRVLWIVMGLLPGILSITGFLMWWNRVVAGKLAAMRAPRTLVDRPSLTTG